MNGRTDMADGPVALLFDLDGTLSDPQEGIGRSINHALAQFGHAEHDLSALTRFIGPPLDESFRRLTGDDTPARIAALVRAYRDRYGAVGYAENLLYPGIPEALAALAASGTSMALCTSKRADFAHRILELFGLRHHFRFISGGEIGVQKWQQIEALKAQGQVDDDTLMIGDRSFDLIAARRNGLRGVGVLWGHGTQDELEAEGPWRLLGHPGELTGLPALAS